MPVLKNNKQIGRAISFNPFLVAQGVVIFSVFLCTAILVGNFFVPQGGGNQKLVIENMATRQTQAAVAGLPVRYSTLVKASEIQGNRHLVALPKGATNITVKKITQSQAKKILSQTSVRAQNVSLAQKQLLADVAPKKPAPKNVFAKITRYLLASLDGALEGGEAEAEVLVDVSVPVEAVEVAEVVDESSVLPDDSAAQTDTPADVAITEPEPQE